MVHHEGVLVDLQKIATFPWSPVLAQVQTPMGRAVVRWCGNADDLPGPYHVEWTVDQTITWGRNAKPAAVAEPGIGPGGHCVILRGRLRILGPGAAALTLDDHQILLDVEGVVPDSVDGTWVELAVEREKIELYPYSL